VNRVTALMHVIKDESRPHSERNDAVAALRSLITDGSDPAERQQAQAAINSLESDHPETAVDTRLENELLSEYHAAMLADIQYPDIHAFCSKLKFSEAAQNLYMKWLSVSPVAQKKMQQMRKHLQNYFIESYDNMLARFKNGLDSGGDMNALNREALAFYRDWIDSGIIPEELQLQLRQLMAALSARCEGHSPNASLKS
jgi:hypothetical protein